MLGSSILNAGGKSSYSPIQHFSVICFIDDGYTAAPSPGHQRAILRLHVLPPAMQAQRCAYESPKLACRWVEPCQPRFPPMPRSRRRVRLPISPLPRRHPLRRRRPDRE